MGEQPSSQDSAQVQQTTTQVSSGWSRKLKIFLIAVGVIIGLFLVVSIGFAVLSFYALNTLLSPDTSCDPTLNEKYHLDGTVITPPNLMDGIAVYCVESITSRFAGGGPAWWGKSTETLVHPDGEISPRWTVTVEQFKRLTLEEKNNTSYFLMPFLVRDNGTESHAKYADYDTYIGIFSYDGSEAAVFLSAVHVAYAAQVQQLKITPEGIVVLFKEDYGDLQYVVLTKENNTLVEVKRALQTLPDIAISPAVSTGETGDQTPIVFEARRGEILEFFVNLVNIGIPFPNKNSATHIKIEYKITAVSESGEKTILFEDFDAVQIPFLESEFNAVSHFGIEDLALTPGKYQLIIEANPDKVLEESDYSNNTTQSQLIVR